MSPVLSNLFLHYVFDVWMARNHQGTPWCRYADDGLVHCKTLEQAENILAELQRRFTECGLELHPEKTKIVYCKDGKRKGKYPNKSFDFLGYTFRTRGSRNKAQDSNFANFAPAVSKIALKSMRATTRRYGLRNRSDLSLEDIAKIYNPILQGWVNYYGRYTRSEMYPVWRHFNLTLMAWAQEKYRHLRRCNRKTGRYLTKIAKERPQLFVHWRIGMSGSFA